jgi:hypothetical protein
MVAITGYNAQGATAQDAELTADLVEGTCDSPGDSVGELRALGESEGGVLTSFTRVDLAIDDITGDDHAVVVSLDGDAVACGGISGSGNDVYVPVVAQGDGGYGGVAWLHAREEQTQISLFVSDQLAGSGGDGPEPPADETETPAPPDETETAEPRATRTPRGGNDVPTPTSEPQTGEGTTYESPSFGYTFTYDDSWEVREEGTNPTDNGPQDFVHLYNGTSHAYFFTNGAPNDYSMENIPDLFLGRLTNAEGNSNVAILQDENGDDIVQIDEDEAIVAYTFTWTTADGQALELYDHYHVFRIPGEEAVVIFLNEGLAVSYDQQASARDALTDSFQIP